MVSALQCSKCDHPAVYMRRQTAERLCASCLVKTTRQRVQRTINKRGLLRENDTILVAVSGGKDSAVLLDALVAIEADYPHARLIPVTIDEGIEGYRDRALGAARQLAHDLGLQLVIRTFRQLFGLDLDSIVRNRQEGSTLGACSYCGVLRRRALNAVALELEADVIATGHNLDDEAQTVIMNLIRGDGLRLVRTNRPRDNTMDGFVPRVKPLIEIPERDIVAYAHHREIPYHDVPCPYADEALRNDLRRFLNEMEYMRPGTLYAVLRSAEALSEALRQHMVMQSNDRCQICGSPTKSSVCKACAMLEELRGGP
ncbi:MAG: TIGR00269 family protein [Candidatus Thorarchaeota archaeon]|nr:TIGR00269 family protein [Candidatus Thorarchaeota archaeon]